MWYITAYITNVDVTVTFNISCYFVTAGSVTVDLGCMPFQVSHLSFLTDGFLPLAYLKFSLLLPFVLSSVSSTVCPCVVYW